MTGRRRGLDVATVVAGLAIFAALGSIVGGDALVLVWGLFAIAALQVATTHALVVRRVSLLVAAIALPLALIETGLKIASSTGPSTTYRDDGTDAGFLQKPAPLGFRPYPSQRYHARKFWADGRPIYDVDYTIGTSRLRETPSGDRAAREKTALFFGGSLVFGEGVQDGQTLPYYYAEALDHRVHVVNFGVMGYGTHQMLRALELGLPVPEVQGRVVACYYVLITPHLERIVNESTWGHWDPRYRVGPKGKAQFDGHFVRHSNWLAEAIVTSRLRRKTYPLLSLGDDQKIELMIAIIEASRQRIAKSFGASLEVLVWSQGSRADAVAGALERAGLPYLRVTDILGDLGQEVYRIAGDGHPTPLAHRRLGYALAGRLLASPNHAP